MAQLPKITETRCSKFNQETLFTWRWTSDKRRRLNSLINGMQPCSLVHLLRNLDDVGLNKIQQYSFWCQHSLLASYKVAGFEELTKSIKIRKVTQPQLQLIRRLSQWYYFLRCFPENYEKLCLKYKIHFTPTEKATTPTRLHKNLRNLILSVFQWCVR